MVDLFRYCPACGAPDPVFEFTKRYSCLRCGFEYFHNVATAAGVFIVSKGRLLCLERAREPGKGLMALPGGFVDPGERAEHAVLRECREEIGWEPSDIHFLCSFPNEYQYRGMLYHTCDLYFTARDDRLEEDMLCPEAGEVSGLCFMALSELDPERFAFMAVRNAWKVFIREYRP